MTCDNIRLIFISGEIDHCFGWHFDQIFLGFVFVYHTQNIHLSNIKGLHSFRTKWKWFEWILNSIENWPWIFFEINLWNVQPWIENSIINIAYVLFRNFELNSKRTKCLFLAFSPLKNGSFTICRCMVFFSFL